MTLECIAAAAPTVMPMVCQSFGRLVLYCCGIMAKGRVVSLAATHWVCATAKGALPVCQARFFWKTIKLQAAPPRTVTFTVMRHRAVRDMQAGRQLPTDTKQRPSMYLKNLTEQDHRGVKFRIGPMRGLKRLEAAAPTIAGVELLRRTHKGQINLRRLSQG
jgi:hypothetical protein